MKIKKTKILPTSVVKHYSFLTILETHIFETDVTLRLFEKPPYQSQAKRSPLLTKLLL